MDGKKECVEYDSEYKNCIRCIQIGEMVLISAVFFLYSGIKSLINQQNCGKIEIENREGGRKNGICNEYSSESASVYKVR